jgi:hypothetical protein
MNRDEMERMAHWAVIIPAEQWTTERLFHNDTLTLAAGAPGVAADDEVLLIADGHVVGLARAGKADGEMTYLRHSFDAPVLLEGLALTGEITPVDAEIFRRLAAGLGARPGTEKRWLVSVTMPIEAANPAEAVRQFWSHVSELGPAELPTYVWPLGDELAMQVYVLGEQANQDPEEEDDED